MHRAEHRGWKNCVLQEYFDAIPCLNLRCSFFTNSCYLWIESDERQEESIQSVLAALESFQQDSGPPAGGSENHSRLSSTGKYEDIMLKIVPLKKTQWWK